MIGGELPTYCLAKPRAWQDDPWEGRHGRQGRQQDLRIPWDCESGTVGVNCGHDQGRRRRVAGELPRRRLRDVVHRQVQLEQPADRQRDPADELLEAVHHRRCHSGVAASRR